MSADLELLSPNDCPALISSSDGHLLDTSKAALSALGYKVHAIANPGEFAVRFAQAPYQVVILEESDAASQSDSPLRILQTMPMHQRRHATVVLIGDRLQTMNAMQAFQQSVHAVINRADLPRLGELLQKAISDTELFYGIYRDTQLRMAEGR